MRCRRRDGAVRRSATASRPVQAVLHPSDRVVGGCGCGCASAERLTVRCRRRDGAVRRQRLHLGQCSQCVSQRSCCRRLRQLHRHRALICVILTARRSRAASATASRPVQSVLERSDWCCRSLRRLHLCRALNSEVPTARRSRVASATACRPVQSVLQSAIVLSEAAAAPAQSAEQ